MTSPGSTAVADEPRVALGRDALDQAGVKALFEQYYDSIWRLVRRFGVPERLADDAAQQVFLILAERRETVRAGSERAFLYGTAVRLASSLRRVERREVLTDAADDAASRAPRPDELTDQKRARDLLDLILSELEADVLKVFALYELEGFTLPEIAEMVGVPLGTATSRLRRGREQFRAGVQRFGANQASSAPRAQAAGGRR